MSWCLFFEILFGTIAFLSVTFALPPNFNFASCLNGKTQGECSCSEGKVMARLSNRLLCFDRYDECPNGFIGLLGTCNCLAGKNLTDGSCLKICPNCINGWCSSAEKCECNSGFKMSRENKCDPICKGECPQKNSFCSSPGVCSCKEGYKRTKNNTNCTPICKDKCLKYEFCSAPGKCSCIPGYRKYDGTCVTIPEWKFLTVYLKYYGRKIGVDEWRFWMDRLIID